ncbi:hypothetical protein C0993_009679, partial [Termitomyces sp. T159_Od127]
MGGDLLEDLERAEAFVIELDQGPLSLQVVLVKPNKGAGGPVGGRFAAGVSVLGVGLVGGVDFVLEELVQRLEILGHFVGYVGGDVSKGEGDEDCLLGEVADDDEDGIKPLRLGKFDNMVHTDGGPGGVWEDQEGFEKTVGAVVGNLGPEARLTGPDILGDVLLHTWPKVSLGDELEGVTNPRVPTELMVVMLAQDLLMVQGIDSSIPEQKS